MKLRHALGLLCLSVLLGTPVRPLPSLQAAEPTSAPAIQSWQFVVTLADPARGLLDVSMTLRGFSGDVRLTVFMDGAESYVSAMKRQSPGPAITYKDGYWTLPAVQAQGASLSYRFDLRAMADRQNSADYAERVGGTYLWNDQAVLLHPSPYPRPDDAKDRPLIDVEFQLPEGISLITPWPRAPGKYFRPRFRFDTDQHDGGSYIAMGTQLEYLGALQAGKTVGKLYIYNTPHRASDEALRTWIGSALQAVGKFYGDHISKELSILLVPVPGNSDPGIFGTVLRRGNPSAIIYFGADCTAPSMANDWVAIHELFHIGNVILDEKISWLTEGFTTYYQDILRIRARALSAEEAWGDLHDGFRRFCQPLLRFSLEDESKALRYTHRYQRVYWGGACLAFLADVNIRAKSRGQRSLDDVMLKLRDQSLKTPLELEPILEALDAEAGDHAVSRMLREKRTLNVNDWYQQLGIVPTGDISVRFVDTAPLAAIRKAMSQ